MSLNLHTSIFLLGIALFQFKGSAQTALPKKCLTDVMLRKRQLADPSFKLMQNSMDQFIAQTPLSAARQTQVISIPVVVHVVHFNGTENISNQQIIDGIAHLNEAFANAGNYNHASGVNTNIQFCLAQQDPSGNFTNGITRTVSQLTNMVAENDDVALKNLVVWNTNKYLNIWLVKEISSLSLGPSMAGYATLPSSHGQLFDGIVNEAGFFGSTIDNSKVHIHEAGHYLGLYHTFEGGCTNNNCQTDGDKVCDTPPDNSTAPVGCNASVNTCTTDADDHSTNNPFRPVALGGLGDQPDMFRNYMDYGYQACQVYFTNGQSTRMNTALSTSRMSLITSNGCVSACTIPISMNVTANDSTVDIGNTVLFNSTTTNATTLDWKINNTSVSSAASFTYAFTTPGNYVVSITGSNADASCVKTGTLLIHVDCSSKASFQLTTQGPYAPSTAVTATNTSQNFSTSQWIVDGVPASTATNWSQVFNTVGGHSVFLITDNGACIDSSSTAFFQVGNCNLSGVTNNWVFDKNHVNFTTGNNPALVGNGPAFQQSTESSSTISDRDGNLLFFSDGINCWDRNKQLMPNGSGLSGHISSTQGVLITPHPGNSKQYYLFTNDAIENQFTIGLRYSIIDMTLNGGLGDIIPSTKNTLLITGGTEHLSATWHANGHDIWIGTALNNSNTKCAFLIDNAGIHPQPVMSSMGAAINTALGSMVFSQDGNRMAECVMSAWPWRILVTDFNKTTGQYSHPIELVLSSLVNEQVFSLLFSPDNSKLYASLIQGSDIFQYDLGQTTASQIMASRLAVDPIVSTFFGHMALGRNGKIYVQSYTLDKLDVINNPNLAGLACAYQQNAFSLSSTGSGFCLPNMLQGYSSAFKPGIAGPKDICVGANTYTYGILLEAASDVAVWSHSGQGTFTTQPGTNNALLTSAAASGTDTIRVTITGMCGTSYDTLIVHTNMPETAMLSDTTFTCDSVRLSPGTSFLTYEWQNASNYSSLMAYTPGLYWVKLKGASGCIITNTTRVFHYPAIPTLDLGPDKVTCRGQVTVLQANHSYYAYHWQDGSNNPSYSAYLPGSYSLTVTDQCGATSTDAITVTNTQVNLNLNYNGSDTICSTLLPVTLSGPNGFTNYLWSDGLPAQTRTITATGIYELKATDAQGCYSSDSVWVITCAMTGTVTGLSENEQAAYYFPNPANDKITLVSNGSQAHGDVTVYSSLGALVYSTSWDATSLEIPTAQLTEGIYFIRTGRQHLKLMVKH
jgi:hypothetical protein